MLIQENFCIYNQRKNFPESGKFHFPDSVKLRFSIFALIIFMRVLMLFCKSIHYRLVIINNVKGMFPTAIISYTSM